MKIKRADLFYKSNIVNSLISKEEMENKESKLKYAIQRFNKNVEKIAIKNKEESEEIMVNLASEDEKGNLITNEKGHYSYSKSNEVEKRKKLKQLEDKEDDFEPYFFKDKEQIAKFDLFVQEELKGVFFEETTAE